MSSNPQKAAPREKNLTMSPKRYLVTGAPHYIGLRIEPIGAIVALPEGVTPGKYLVEVDSAGNPIKKPDKGAKAE